MRRLIYLSIQIIHSFLQRRRMTIIEVLYTFKGRREKSTVRNREISFPISFLLSLSHSRLFLSMQARWSNSKNLQDDPIRRWDQRGRYDRAEKSYLASAIAGMERGTRVFLAPSFWDVEWHNLVAIAVVHRMAEIV